MRDLTPKPAEWIDRAPVKFRASREIAATPEEVWSALCDHERWPVWFSALSGAGATGGEGIGSTRFVMVGKDRIDETFVIWDEPRSWGFTVDRAEGPIGRIGASLNERVDIQVLSNDRVRVTYLMGFDPRPRTRFVFRLIKRQMTKNLRSALAGLERFIESERAITS